MAARQHAKLHARACATTGVQILVQGAQVAPDVAVHAATFVPDVLTPAHPHVLILVLALALEAVQINAPAVPVALDALETVQTNAQAVLEAVPRLAPDAVLGALAIAAELAQQVVRGHAPLARQVAKEQQVDSNK
ncbi:MAG: hypothetical protein RR365_00930 [Bacteroides sp.]